jgi:hypothetical protein
MTQTTGASGPEELMKKWEDTLRQMERNAPKGMEMLESKLNRISSPNQ